MATIGHSPTLCGVLSETKLTIRANSRHFLALSILFLLPLSFASILYPSLITTLSTTNFITSHYHQNSRLLITLLYMLFVFLFSIFATASISYSTFHGFYNRSVSFISSIKSILFSIFPLLLTVLASQFILIFIFVIFGLLGALLYEGLLTFGVDVDYGSNYLLGFVICMTILILVVTIYMQVEWSLAYVVAVVESKWGFAPLKRSAYLINGMKWIALSIMLYYGILTGVLTISCSTLLVYLGGINGGWAAILEIVLCSVLLTMMMLSYVAAYTVLYIYCKVLHGEMAFDIADESAEDYVSLPVDDGKV
ncbi:unnamed protein product [Fraxinus pennsylvanica]|uniref:Uncharacterized protein n=1 Tax=Fraxinus pennsylvanica TaxID=56036 RepID=A0AAD2EAW5_9LAMI|nr:unnamed protein product [Fraxinus pennsylvanica]